MSSKSLDQPLSDQELFNRLQQRFEQHAARHPDLSWSDVLLKLQAHPEKIQTLHWMEQTGGEPDLIQFEQNQYFFVDYAEESPQGRRSLCYDAEALAARKQNPPQDSAVHLANQMGAVLLTEQQYRELQQWGNFDTKTSSWIETPTAIRALGGALFCDRRYGQVFTYHNGAESYYAARGFRVAIKL
ncbi:DUF4256 domain-containing protein [Acinetobacter zhairhuonensis]|uniref:DUF4256 domain-containing protein n=1 Tax=Acinetobacter sp. A7.4 TaxID=2919921 RepID=UPI001F4F1AB9|nr:DUF4256 domain-containing protein [Acinetobacter sp. A7.4]MCJ8161686.1 DUF4256 domain-containing protein [Acinetobacter sp. A7.4]